MQIVEKKIEEIKPYEKNPRKNDGAVQAVANSISQFGFKVPVVIDKDNVIVCGHTRYKAAKKLGLEAVPCVIADDLTEEQIKAYRLADNKVSELAEWDIDLLGEELDGIFDIDMSDFGFDLTEEEEEETEIIEDEIPEEVEPIAKMGDIWQLGRHRLMCGDSTSVTDVKKLIDGNKIDMLFTDPPYNMDYCGAGFISERTGNVREKIKDIIDFNPYEIEYIKQLDIGSFYIFTSKDLIYDYMTIFNDYKFNILTWNKTNSPPFVNNNFFADTEYCLYFHKDKRVWNNGLKPIEIYKKYYISSITEGSSEYEKVHPTMKPIKFISDKIRISSNEKGNVLDIFGGSGSTLIACEQLDRNCFMMELDPHYVDVIIARWEQFTGQKAVLLND